ncbi:MAG: VWA domain-containing protein [Lachnospiraceae bacterium]|nr:VWA domain-containing protein [Lachnospiraceae bacterium]
MKNLGLMTKKIMAGVLSASLAVTMLAGCGGVRTENDDRADALSYDDAQAEMNTLLKKVSVSTVEDPILDIYSEEVSEADALADIDTFPITVRGNGDIDIEVAAATEMSADAPDDWMNEVAKKFNKAGYTVGAKSVSVSVRKITSGEAVTYMNAGAYEPQVFAPSNFAWGEMLKASGIGITKIEDRIAGNTAGILIKKDVYDSFIEKYKEATVGNVLTASNAGDLTFAYTNPYTSSTGLNILTAMLKSFDNNNPLSEQASQALLEYQKSSPPVAYTTAVLRNSAKKGIINAMVMEEQAYVNTPELKDFVYVPAGIRHDHPIYTFDWDSDEEVEAAKLFTEYCKNEASQKLATEKGFNRHDDYQAQDPGLTGAEYLAAQKLWKQNKNGGKPIIAVFVADVSGSMDGEPLNALKSSLINASSYIGSDHYIGLVSYASKVTINLPIEQFDATQRAYFAGEVKNLSAVGGTATYDAVLVGLDMLEKKAKEVPDAKLMLFVLTDGDQNEGWSLSRVTGIVGGLQVPIYSIAYNYSNTDELERLSNINEAAIIKAGSDDIANQIRNLFNVQL